MKILFISVHGDPLAKLGSAQAGGQNNYVRQITLALEKRGHQIDVASHQSNKRSWPQQIYGQQIRAIRLSAGHPGFVRKGKLYEYLPDFFTELSQRVNLASYDVIHSNYWLSGLVGLMIREQFAKPLIHTSHSLGHVKARMTGVVESVRLLSEKRILQEADWVIATTNDEKNKIMRLTGQQSNVAIISIGVSQIFFAGGPRVLPEQTRFIFTGRLNQAKGIVVLLKAFRQYLDCCDAQARLVIAGGGKEDFSQDRSFEPRSALIRSLLTDIREQIDFLGPTTQEELSVLYRTGTALIVPSHYESFGMVASEAQAAGLPVIASRVGGLKDVVRDGESGLLFRNKSADDLLDCMKRISIDRTYNQWLGEQAVRHAQAHFDWDQIAADLEAIYEQAIG